MKGKIYLLNTICYMIVMISQYLAETLFEWICILLHVRSHAKEVSAAFILLL